MGDIQLSLYDRKGVLEVEVIRARGLLPKPGSKILPGKENLRGVRLNNHSVYLIVVVAEDEVITS